MIVSKNIPIILFSIIICGHALAVEPRTKPAVKVEGEAENVAQAEKVSEPKPSFFPPMTTLTQGELKPLLEKWDKAIESDRMEEKRRMLSLVSHDVSEKNMRFRGSLVLRYDNSEIIDRIVGLYLKECARRVDDDKREGNPWYDGDGEYMIYLMTMAESTFDPRIYETEMMHIGVTGELRLLYLATVNPEKTLKYLFESKRGYRVGTKKGHPDYFYHGRTAWGISVDRAYTLLSLMCVQSPTILNRHRDRVLSFVKEHVKHFTSPRTVSYKTEPVYPKMNDYDVRNGALDILELLGAVEDVELVEEIVRGAPQLEPKKLKGGPRDRREQIQHKGERVIGLIRRRQKTQDR